MPLKKGDRSGSPAFEVFENGFTWIAYPDEGMQRASHALDTKAGIWLVDPIDADSLDERIAELGEVTGVVLLLDRHERDAARIADRHGVPVTRPPGITRKVDVPATDVTGGLPETDFEFLEVLDWPGWHEVALWDGGTLVVPESLGTNAFGKAGKEPVGLNPVSRLSPPKHLAQYEPERLLVGHGSPVLEGATPAMQDALANARRRIPNAWLRAIKAIW